MMKTLVFVASVLALSSGQWAPAHHGYHIPVIGPGGVPVETPEVQQARASHLAALNQASSVATHSGQYEGQHNDDRRYYGPHAYPTTHGVAKVTQDGVPLDTPEVAAAKANHFGLFSEALGRVAHSYPGGHHYRKRRSIYAGAYHGIHIPVIGPHGVPVDTPEVQHARAAHLAALAAAGGHAGHHVYAAAAPVYSHGFYGLSHDGRPLDTPEVAHAKAAHFAAYNAAAALNGVGHYGHGYASYAHGVPADTPEVAHAKAAHFAAHAAARGHHY